MTKCYNVDDKLYTPVPSFAGDDMVSHEGCSGSKNWSFQGIFLIFTTTTKMTSNIKLK